MLNKKVFLALFVSFSLIPVAASAFHHDDGKLQDTVTLRLDAQNIDTLRLDVGAGATVVSGDSQLDEIIVEAKIYQKRAADNYDLSLERSGSSRALLIADTDSGGLFWSNETWIDLTVMVPDTLDIDLNDGSGPIEVQDILGDLRIDDGSGEININNVGGDIDIDDGSGPIYAADLGGDIRIDDGSGSIKVRNAAGTVTVDDGSGSIDVDGAANFVLIDDGTGGVDVDNVSGDIDMGP